MKAFAWASLAAGQGEKEAAENKAVLRDLMTSQHIAKAQKLADELFERIECSKLK